MMISQKQISENGKGKLMSLPVDFLASRLVSPEEEKERKTTAISGQNLNVPYEKSDRLGLLVRMLLESYQWYNPARVLIWKTCLLRSVRKSKNSLSNPSAKTLKTKDILSNRWLFRLVPSVHPISETECGLLPTITASDYKKRGPNSKQVGIAEFIRMNLFPTPQAVDSSIGAVIGQNDHFILTKNGLPRKVNQNGSNGSVGLARIFQIFPLKTTELLLTPSATDGVRAAFSMDSLKNHRKKNAEKSNLAEQIAHKVGGGTSQLNPLFVEEMMGFPTYWILTPFLKESSILKGKTPILDGEQNQ